MTKPTGRWVQAKRLVPVRGPLSTQTGHDRLGLFNYLVGAGEDRRRGSVTLDIGKCALGFGVKREMLM